MNENVEVDSSTPISYGDLRISSDRRKGPCLFWVCIVYTLSRPALSGHERLSHHICELQFRWFLMWPRASMWQTSTPSSWPTADLLKGHRKAAGSLLPNVRARASAPATTPHVAPATVPTRATDTPTQSAASLCSAAAQRSSPRLSPLLPSITATAAASSLRPAPYAHPLRLS